MEAINSIISFDASSSYIKIDLLVTKIDAFKCLWSLGINRNQLMAVDLLAGLYVSNAEILEYFCSKL